jgi:hypothetical protein
MTYMSVLCIIFMRKSELFGANRDFKVWAFVCRNSGTSILMCSFGATLVVLACVVLLLCLIRAD